MDQFARRTHRPLGSHALSRPRGTRRPTQQGRILRLDPSTNAFLPLEEKTLSLSFLSYLVVGHHAHLAANYLHRHQNAPSLLNRLLFGLHSAKKFCCLGKPSLEEGTGLVELSFTDEKGHSVEIAKQVGGKRGVASVVLSNIDRFQGGKLEGGKMNDGKLELGVLESSSEWRLITSVGAVEGRLRG